MRATPTHAARKCSGCDSTRPPGASTSLRA
jgi:hypothetical protein